MVGSLSDSAQADSGGSERVLQGALSQREKGAGHYRHVQGHPQDHRRLALYRSAAH